MLASFALSSYLPARDGLACLT